MPSRRHGLVEREAEIALVDGLLDEARYGRVASWCSRASRASARPRCWRRRRRVPTPRACGCWPDAGASSSGASRSAWCARRSSAPWPGVRSSSPAGPRWRGRRSTHPRARRFHRDRGHAPRAVLAARRARRGGAAAAGRRRRTVGRRGVRRVSALSGFARGRHAGRGACRHAAAARRRCASRPARGPGGRSGATASTWPRGRGPPPGEGARTRSEPRFRRRLP
jgi:hypothetical protein